VITGAFRAAAVIDLSRRTKLRLTGADRVRFLNGQVSNDVRLASETASIYTCVMTIKGKMCADAFIHAASATLVLDAEPEARDSLSARLEKYIIADDVALEDVTDEMGLLHLLPTSLEASESGADLPAHAVLDGACGLHFTRCWRYGGRGLDVFGDPDAIAQARTRLAATYPVLGDAEIETRRILAGVPKWGVDLDENTMPAEAGLEERAVSYSKGCYIGQEVVSRVKSVGHVNRQLRGVRSSGPVSLAANSILYPPDAQSGSREAGRVTSVASDPTNEHASIGLAFVRRGWESAGTVLAARPAPPCDSAPDKLTPAGPDLAPAEPRVMVCELPFI
jgi:folate-binding protein YgfZ